MGRNELIKVHYLLSLWSIVVIDALWNHRNSIENNDSNRMNWEKGKKAKNKSAYEHAIFDNDLWFFSWAGCKRPKVKTFTEFSMRKSYWQIMKIIMYFCAVEWIAERNFEHANCTQVVRFICAVISVRWFYKQQPKANSLIVDVLST